MAIGTDISIDVSGNIRYVGAAHGASGAGYYTVIAFHRWLADLMDDAVASGDDILDITDLSASDRSTDNIITLINSYNIDDVLAEHLYDGSIIQSAGNEIYDGILVYANSGADLQIYQNGSIIARDFWNTIPFGLAAKGLNADTSNGISHRFMLKVRTGAADIDLRKIIGQTRVSGQTYSEFKINGTSRGNNVMALTFADDLNDSTADGTRKGWTTVTNLTAGYNAIDVDANSTNEYYYSKWDRAGLTINQFYERMKYLGMQAPVEDSCTTGNGTDVVIGNGTLVGQGQSFTTGANVIFPTKVKARFKKTLVPTGSVVCKIYAHSGTYGTSSVPNTGTLVATSNSLDVSKFTTAYDLYTFQFTMTNAETGTPGANSITLDAATQYVVAFEYSAGDASNYISIDSTAASQHGGNRSSSNGTWSASATTDLYFQVYSSPVLYKMPGEMFRGITHEIPLAQTGSITGTFSANETITWTAGTGGAVGSGKVLATSQVTGSLTSTSGTGSVAPKMWIQLLTGGAPGTAATITGVTSSATCATHSVATVEKSVSIPFCGVSTGSALIGAFGFALEATDYSASDLVFDLHGNTINPPDYRTSKITGLNSTTDRVLVGPANGAALRDDQCITNAAYTQATTTFVLASGTETIGTGQQSAKDTPTTGTIRVKDNNGVYQRVTYTGFTAGSGLMTFTGCTASGTWSASAGNNAFISYIDKVAAATFEQWSAIFQSARTCFVRVRYGGASGSAYSDAIKTFQGTVSYGSDVAAIRTADA